MMATIFDPAFNFFPTFFFNPFYVCMIPLSSWSPDRIDDQPRPASPRSHLPVPTVVFAAQRLSMPLLVLLLVLLATTPHQLDLNKLECPWKQLC